MKPYEEIKEDIKERLKRFYATYDKVDTSSMREKKDKILKFLNNLDEYTKQEIMEKTVNFAKTDKKSYVTIMTNSSILRFFDMIGEDIIKLNDIVSVEGDKLHWKIGNKINAINKVCEIVANEYGINFTPFEDGKITPEEWDLLDGKNVDSALKKLEDETEEHFIDRKEQYELQSCVLGYQKGTFESDIREKYNIEREELKNQQENIKSVEIKEEQIKEEMEPVEIRKEQIKEKMEPKMSRREELAYIGSGKTVEDQIKSQYEKLKKAYNDLSPLKKAWYKATKKAVKMDGEWMIDEPIELGEENGRSFR